MPAHEYFEELCSLTVLGEVSAGELATLAEHMRECPTCRATYAEFRELAEEHLAVADDRADHTVPAASTALLRQRTLSALSRQVSPEAMRGPSGSKKWLEDLRWTLSVHAPQLKIALVALVVLTFGIVFVERDAAHRQQIEDLHADLLRVQQSAARLQQDSQAKNSKLDQVSRSEMRAAEGIAQLQQLLADAAARTARLQSEHQRDVSAIQSLEEQSARLAAQTERLASDKAALEQRANGGETEVANIRKQLLQLRAVASDRETQLGAAQTQIADLSNKLKAQETALDRERQLLAAGRDVRDLMGARNLHIIDVHDMDSRGESRPFGRIFLTEGKRLIFYAYDLDTAKVKNASFQVWGQRDSNTPAAVNLGIFYMDDQKQSRWALKVEDPSLLQAIDSVFVTVEAHGGVAKPTGKKLMYAYLRNPINHP